MRFSFDIARRYLFGKKRMNAINWITGVSVVGIAIGSTALILVLSVFNGLETLITGYLNAFNPDVKILPVEGKRFDRDSINLSAVLALPGVASASLTLEEVALFEYKGAQKVGIIKGVDSNYTEVTDIDSTIREGHFRLEEPPISYAVIGSVMATELGVNFKDVLTPVTIYMPKQKKVFRQESDFRTMEVYPSGSFSVQTENDNQYVLTSLDFANRLMQTSQKLTAIELKLASDASSAALIEDIRSQAGPSFDVLDRYRQDETFLRIMNIERWVSYLIVSLTLLLVACNLIGCLWMIVLDKKKDIAILRAMGMTSASIKRLFLNEGLLIGLVGLLIGIGLSLVLYFIQSNYGIVPIPEGFAIDAYPIEIRATDYLVVSLTVVAVAFLASYFPAYRAARMDVSIRGE